MARRFSINFGIFAFVLDGLLVAGSLYAANAVRPLLNALPFVAYFPDPQVPWILYPVFSLVWVGMLLFFAVYDGRRRRGFARDWLYLTGGSLLAGVALAGVLFLTFRETSRVLFLTFFIFAYLSLTAWRVLFAVVQAGKKQREDVPRVLVIGATETGRAIGERIRSEPEHGLELVGYLDDHWEGAVGKLDQAAQVIDSHAVDEIVIALPDTDHEQVAALVNVMHQLPVRLWVIPNYFQLALFRAGIEEFAGIPMLDLHAPAISEHQRVVKRVLDLVISLLVLIPGIPLMGLIALVIWLDTGSPVLFRQSRVGENGRLFSIYKFRTMVPGAEQLDTGEHKKADDPRVTRVGRFLRRTSLDELPQFFNVLKGEMSLVGPRPELPEIVSSYEPWQRQRFTVPPGITGWWQVTGRSERMMHLHTEDDLYYVKNYSLMLDLQILARTLWVVVKGEGAW